MKEQIRTTVQDLNATNMCCPRCGREYTPVEYYTGYKLSEETKSKRISSDKVWSETTTTYRDVQKHTGGICRYCDAENLKRTLKKLILVGVAGIISFIVGLLIVFGVIALSQRLGYFLFWVGMMAFTVGLFAILIWVKTNPSEKMREEFLFDMYMNRLSKEGGKNSELEYLSAKEWLGLRVYTLAQDSRE